MATRLTNHYCPKKNSKTYIRVSELQYAIINKHIIKFNYFNSELQQAKRTVEPLRLVFKSNAWYVVGYCLDKQDIRIFRLSRIRQIRVLPELFKRELPQNYILGGGDKKPDNIFVFKLKFNPEIAVRLYDEFQENQVSVCEDGYYMITIHYPLSNWTFNRLLSYGKYVEVIEPEIARTMLKEKALEIAEIYD
ncbi:MAG: helix-turn-helix transcriptional regulator [Lachnospiraceae bacterium]